MWGFHKGGIAPIEIGDYYRDEWLHRPCAFFDFRAELKLRMTMGRRSSPDSDSSQRFAGFEYVVVNDPSAGSPTETLLRLLLPLDEVICITSKPASYNVVGWNTPKGSSIHPIGRSDGRCVQRAGT